MSADEILEDLAAGGLLEADLPEHPSDAERASDMYRGDEPKRICHECGQGDRLVDSEGHPKGRYWCERCNAVTTGSPLAHLNHQAAKKLAEAERLHASDAHQAWREEQP